MSKSIQNIKGMPDLLPKQTGLWQRVESTIHDLLQSYGYSEIRLPIVESTGLFKRSIGEVTDIVEKEMYTFPDRNDDLMTLRPEGTAGCVRACMQHGLLDNQQQQKLWYQGPMFRYERPQKGRQRQFHQLGVETFGIATPDVEAELLLLTSRLWKGLGIDQHVKLQLNTIGSLSSREEYKAALVDFLMPVKDQLDEDSQRRLDTNPLRILDSKDQDTQKLLQGAPELHDFIDEDSRQHFSTLCQYLDALDIPYIINQRLVRGLDYYNKTVFEWVTDSLGAQGTVCAGGRYDGLVEQLGGKHVPAVGFAMGLERLTLLVETLSPGDQNAKFADIYFVIAGDEELYTKALKISETLRSELPQDISMMTHCGAGSIKSQMKKADKSGASLALIVGSNEIEAGEVTVKPLREGFGIEQQQCKINALAELIDKLMSKPKG